MAQLEETRHQMLQSVNWGDLRTAQAAKVLGVRERHV